MFPVMEGFKKKEKEDRIGSRPWSIVMDGNGDNNLF